jgi:CHAT domain-containing protein
MDTELFLGFLRDHTLEEGRVHIQEHVAELSDHAATGELLADEALRLLYSPFVSLKLAELLIFFGEYVHHTSSHALGLKAKGDALEQIGHHQTAMECLDAAGEEFLHLGDEANQARSRISWVTACFWQGRVEEALQEAARTHDVFLRLGEPYWACVIDHNRAWFYFNMGRYQDALKLYENMLVIYPTLTDQSEISIKRSIALAQVNLAIDLASLGNFEQAYHLQQQVQASFDSLGEADLVINAEIDLADLDYIQGYYGSALRRYYQARDGLIQNSLESSMLMAELKLRIANCLVKLNRAQEACRLADEAVKIYQQLGTLLQASIALCEYATTLVASGRLKEALATLDEAWNLFNREGFEPYAFTTKLQQTELLLEMGSATTAYEQACLVKEYFEARGLVGRSVRARLVMAGALIDSVQQIGVHQEQEKEKQAALLREAVLLCKEISIQARQHNLQEEVYKSYYLLGRIFAFQDNLSKAARYYKAAITQIERILDDLVYDLSLSFLHATWSIYEDMIALCLQQSQAERAFGYLEQARSIALRQYINRKVSLSARAEQEDLDASTEVQKNSAEVLRTQYELRDWQERHRYYSILLTDIDTTVSPSLDKEIIQAELKRSEAKLNELLERLHLYQLDTHVQFSTSRSRKRMSSERATVKGQRIDIAQLRQFLAPDQLLLAYYLHKGNLVIFAVTAESLITYENPEGADQLEHLLPLFHAHLQPGGWPDPQQPPQQAIRRLLNKLYNLLIAPVSALLPSSAGSMTIVPYGPLHKLPFHALYDGSSYLIENYRIGYLPASNLLMHLSARESEQDIPSTRIEASIKPPLVFGYSENGYLQRVQDEAKTIASMLEGNCYLERDATIARLIDEAPNSPVIHLATHGQSRLDAPNFSYVRLADGQLNAIDAFNLNLEHCELVTLSGCETGLALSGGGDEQLGLGRAFLAAGATSLVMSLWPVEDAATNELMKLFYQNLLRGESKVQALRAAQCNLLHQNELTSMHPYFWAAFRLVGDVGPLKYKAKDRPLAIATQHLKK